jgi:CHAT domain-containing protein
VLLEALEANPGRGDQVGAVLNHLGIAAQRRGERELAADYYRRSLALFEEEGKRDSAARVLSNQAVLSLEAGDHAAALATFRRALALSEEIGDREAVAETWRNLGLAHEAEGRLDEARAAVLQSLELARAGSFREEIAESLGALAGLALAESKPAAALEVADEAAALAVAIGRREIFWHARTLAGRSHAELGRPQQAREALREAILGIEAMRIDQPGGLESEGILATRLEPYYGLVELEVEAGDPLAALAAGERARARRLLDVLRRSRAVAGEGRSPEEQAGDEALREELARANQALFLARQQSGSAPAAVDARREEVEKARLALRSFRADLQARHPELRTVPEAPSEPSIASLAALASGSATLVLSFAVLDEQSYLLALSVPPGDEAPGVRPITLPVGREGLRRRVEDLHGRLARRDLGFEAAARELYDLLLSPVEEELRGGLRLVIVPDGPLWNLPFQALKDAGSSYLLDRHAISYAPSLAVLQEILGRPAGTGAAAGSPHGAAAPREPVLAIGNPALSSSSPANLAVAARRGRPLAPLPDAEAEVREISRLYADRHGRVLIGAEASESRVKAAAPGFGLLHFATHGVLEDASPLYSHLVLAQEAAGGTEDGLLEAWEVLELRLEADLVVLSACQTARGVVGEGEGLIGLAWAFLAAGSRSVVASQWEVDSAATRALMVEFHRRLVAGEPKAEALQGAARHLAAQAAYRHPFYWAGFVLVGEGAGSLPPGGRAAPAAGGADTTPGGPEAGLRSGEEPRSQGETVIEPSLE